MAKTARLPMRIIIRQSAAFFAPCQEISADAGLRGGPETIQTSDLPIFQTASDDINEQPPAMKDGR
ncbi:hypothetical protein RFN29_24845 [Mesorhizobium sp. VK22B]|uniref:Uncharacterized protein n=1 Tax=Mesorhizobium captivum TaxID=3072319 RepID=A0ABU4ZA18_9HYPH|nr:hypothetical protein [Mesorhizobium sp. VK22B]MDX8494797.1 hypothetical protein [Mesorhizobium sp. VK22B]